MPNVGMLRNAINALISRTKIGLNGLAASALLQEAGEALTRARAEHWLDSTIADIPELIHELARDRDDYKRMAEAYRQDLAKAEAELARLHNLPCRWQHETEEER